MNRYFLQLSYDGTNYSGWQIQPNAKSVQEEIQIALTKLNSGVEVKTMGCGRTDSGVHAKNFFMHFDFSEITNAKKFQYKLNTMLPEDIVIHNVISVKFDAHSRYDAFSRTYHYNLHFEKSPFNRFFSYKYSKLLDVSAMNEAAAILLEFEDFESFSKVKTSVSNFNCTIKEAYWESTEGGLRFVITANRFLRNMVRAIVGTLLEVGIGQISIDDFKVIILSKDRTKAGQSVPGSGLCLTKVNYSYI